MIREILNGKKLGEGKKQEMKLRMQKKGACSGFKKD